MSLNIPALSESDSSGSVDVANTVFGQSFNETLIHQLVVKHLASARAGTKAQKTRSDVSGGGSKPWRQKGTGRARSGTTRSPLWRTGGVTFAARPRSYKQKLNKKMYKVGMRSIFSELLRQGRLVVSQDILPNSHKTKEFAKKIKDFSSRRLLLIVDELNSNIALATRNMPNVSVIEANSLNPLLLVSADKIVASPLALKKIEERLL